jgi:hypothetical protein
MENPCWHVGRQLLVERLLELLEGVHRTRTADRREDVGVTIDARQRANELQRQRR